MNRKRILGSIVCAVGVSVAGLTAATPASADPVNCGEYYCAYVTGINPGSYLAIRTGPHYSSPQLAGFHEPNGAKAIILCYTTGDGDADGHGDHWWWNVMFPAGGNGYVNDWYLTTGGPSAWANLTHC